MCAPRHVQHQQPQGKRPAHAPPAQWLLCIPDLANSMPRPPRSPESALSPATWAQHLPLSNVLVAFSVQPQLGPSGKFQKEPHCSPGFRDQASLSRAGLWGQCLSALGESSATLGAARGFQLGAEPLPGGRVPPAILGPTQLWPFSPWSDGCSLDFPSQRSPGFSDWSP